MENIGSNADSTTASTGESMTTTVTIPEGMTEAQIFALLEERGVSTVEQLEEAAANYDFKFSFLKGVVPLGDPKRLEGYLFPDTYEFYMGEEPVSVLNKMILRFDEIFTDDLGINPQNDGRSIRLNFPQLTEERRKELVKQIRKYNEGGKVAIRNIRRDALEAFKKMQKASEITEDELKLAEKDLQKMIDKGYFGDEAYLNMELGYLFRSGQADADLKQKRRQEEAAAARRALFLLGGKAREPLPYAIPHRDDWKHNLFLVDKVRPTPKTYPRKAGTPTRNPL